MNEKSKSLSCGVVLVNESRQILMIHATNQHHWDIPKGTKNQDEREVDAALRELREETGVILDERDLTDLSWHIYNNYKDLWVFIGVMPNVKTSDLHCTSHYTYNNCEIPEADEFAMIHLEDIDKYCCNSLSRVMENSLKKDINDFLNRKFPNS
jgi:8-oxo-dGTP pyrophosphatase MutT (NUDIX family)